MKKNLIFRITILSILMIFVIISCKKEPLPDPIVVNPVPTKYTVEAISSSGGVISPVGKISVDSGATQNFVLTPNDGFKADSVLVNNVSVPVTSNSYTIANINTNYTIKPVFEKSELGIELGLLTQKPWILTSWTLSAPDFYWKSDFTTRDSVFVVTDVIFNSNNNRVTAYDLNGVLIWDYRYKLTSDSIFIPDVNGIKFKIIELTPTRMVLEDLSPRGDEQTPIIEYLTSTHVFEHKK